MAIGQCRRCRDKSAGRPRAARSLGRACSLRLDGNEGPRAARAWRTIKVALVPALIEFKRAVQVAQLRHTVTRKGKKSVEVVDPITNSRDDDPATLAVANRHRESDFAVSLPRNQLKPAHGTP